MNIHIFSKKLNFQHHFSQSEAIVFRCAELLADYRKVDDMIINSLNKTIPTTSFENKQNVGERCKKLYNEIQEIHSKRLHFISNCIHCIENELKKSVSDDVHFTKLNSKMFKLKNIKSEKEIEKVIVAQTYKIFYEKCRNYFNPTRENEFK
ncbi:Coiled-coil domain-containing protein 58 [Intoshia linei]|uniref:Protein MIX23 n=1 Tax=Intoshia linei TaxID=1819745 RepID=A0A177B8G8_9BILA|nr:Coiled-coil domain-containing protein 58 [Intoshia linei]